MKVAMVGDCAFVGYELAQELRRRGHTVDHITFNHTSKLRYLKALKTPFKLVFADYDIVHAHYLRFPAYAACLSGKPWILHVHGSDVRFGIGKTRRIVKALADKVLASTEDLLPFVPEATYLPNPVGPEFHDYGGARNGAVYFRHPLDPELPAFDGLNVQVRERNVPYMMMPHVLNEYETVVTDHFESLGKLALEALACGCKVLTWKGQTIEGLPGCHRVKNVVDKLIKIYKQTVDKHQEQAKQNEVFREMMSVGN